MITELMANPKAAQHYAEIPASTPPGTLADNYTLAKLRGDADLCLALEAHLRQLAQVRFHTPGVLEALNAMEKAKARRKMGKGGTKPMQAIADAIQRDYVDGTYEIQGGRAVFTIGNVVVRCRNAEAAVAMVVAKYRRVLTINSRKYA